MTNLSKKILLSGSITLLSACGGGGGSDSKLTSSTTTPTTPTALVEKLQTEVTPYYDKASLEFSVIAELNAYRKAIKLGPVNPNKFLDLSAKNHQNYVTLSFRPGDNFHQEIAGRAGFTGASPRDRAIVAGYVSPNSVSETGTALFGSRAIEGLVDTVYHRQPLTMEEYSEVGITSSSENGTIIEIASNGATVQNNGGTFLTTYPYDGQTGVYLTHYAETPWPFPDIPENTLDSLCNLTSYPVHLQVQKLAKLNVTSFTIQEQATGTSIPVRLLTNAIDPQVLPNFSFIVGKAPFKKNTKYTVRFVGTATGEFTGAPKGILDIDKTWSFTTGDQNLVNCPK